MSEPKLISPLLSEHMMGEPISSHHGIRCCPAMKQNSNDKYIVKILSIPASQVQLDALLLTGAYSSKETALAYFKELADAAVEEAEILKKLSDIEGFCGYEGWQVEEMEDATGYDVYLLGPYRPTLEWYFKSNPMTHLAAVNLGLDLCAALSVCRRNGYLYVDLKPGNVFITGSQEYRIGDLGFVKLSSLKYASLPDRYRSAYTAPEIADAFASLNTTLDIYAAGLILYQAYNNGLLPNMDGEELPPPAYADYEMAQIILKACAKNPEDRWQDPAEMGQELAEYMQRNSVNDVPIIPPIEEVPADENLTEEAVEETVSEEVTEEAAEEIPAEEASEETVEEIPEEAAEESAEEAPADETEELPATETVAEETEEIIEQQFVLDGFEADETAPTDADLEALQDAAVSDDTSAMLAQADELIAHEAPGPVVIPEPMQICIPELADEEEAEGPAEETAEQTEEAVAEPAAEEAETTAEEPQAPAIIPINEYIRDDEDASNNRKKRNTPILILSAILVLLLLTVGIFTFYENYYVQLIQNITVSSEFGEMTVTLDTRVDNELLTVVCQDTYGNKFTANVTDNTAHFTGITSNTHYKISVEVSGFHRLIGTTSTNHTTDAQTNIESFTAVTGDQAGSVILNFTIKGEDNFAWRIYYTADGEEEKSVECNGHMATVTGLTVGKTYVFRLMPVVDLHVVGINTITYTASDLIYPQSLTIKGFNNGKLNVAWKAPKDVTVKSWIVRCYNADGFNATYTVEKPQIAIEGLDPAQAYTIDVKAENMSVSEWVSLSANSVTVKDINLDNSKKGQMNITWDFEGKEPAEGWRMLYTIDGGEKQILHCDTTGCTISPLVPGAKYVIAIQLDGDTTVFGGSSKFEVANNGRFDSYGVTWENFKFRMCWTPDNADWRWYNMYENDFTTTFKVGEKASFVLKLDTRYHDDQDDIETLFVIRDANGKVVSANAGRTRIWVAMWSDRYSELDMPVMPQQPGEYTVDIYFNGALVTTERFTVTE